DRGGQLRLPGRLPGLPGAGGQAGDAAAGCRPAPAHRCRRPRPRGRALLGERDGPPDRRVVRDAAAWEKARIRSRRGGRVMRPEPEEHMTRSSKRASLRSRLALCALAAALWGGCGGGDARRDTGPAPQRRIVVLGFDGVDPDFVEQWQDKLPNMAEMMKS